MNFLIYGKEEGKSLGGAGAGCYTCTAVINMLIASESTRHWLSVGAIR